MNISATVTELPSGASGSLGGGAIELANDHGVAGFGGACPPPGEVHRYIFPVHALAVEALDLPAEASNALAGANAIGRARIKAVHTRCRTGCGAPPGAPQPVRQWPLPPCTATSSAAPSLHRVQATAFGNAASQRKLRLPVRFAPIRCQRCAR
ncbi:YbhB/YbcL family Raf kinase inhibitor-like protein [Pseudogemmobacter sonorensis]|uniref:YbhB/YbcL family Raf kinase inhibitor-like protein n=1 Tax=Pseudogemmobacter sonorensis TaxID=2989681 RepID=UPI0036AFF8B4